MFCAHCGPAWTHRVLIGMEPGRDGLPWWLCRRCWADGLATRKAEVAVVAVTPAPDASNMNQGPAKERPKKRSTR